MREIRRRTRVVGAFPDGTCCLNLAAARLRHIAGTRWSTRKYMNMTPLFADQTQAAVVAPKKVRKIIDTTEVTQVGQSGYLCRLVARGKLEILSHISYLVGE